MESKVPERLKVPRKIHIYLNVNRRRLGPFEVGECTIEMAGRKPETSPERWTGHQGGAPMSTDVGGIH